MQLRAFKTFCLVIGRVMGIEGTAFQVLLALLAVSFVVSFFYIAKSRGILTALFWTFIPFRLLLSWGSETRFDDNPPWLDRLQIALIGTLALLWVLSKK